MKKGNVNMIQNAPSTALNFSCT